MADDKDTANKELTDEELKPKKKGLNVILLAVLSIALIAAGLGAGLLMGKQARSEMPKANKLPEKPVIVEFKDIFVNIAETKATRVLKINLALELSEEKLVTVVEERTPLIRDLISETACRMSIDELDSQNGRQVLKREIKNQLNVILRNHMAGAVQNVYFSDFLIQ